MVILFSVNGLSVRTEVLEKIRTPYTVYYKGIWRGEVQYFDKKYCKIIKRGSHKEADYGIQNRRKPYVL